MMAAQVLAKLKLTGAVGPLYPQSVLRSAQMDFLEEQKHVMTIILRIMMGALIVKLMLDTNVLGNLQFARFFAEMAFFEAQKNVMIRI